MSTEKMIGSIQCMERWLFRMVAIAALLFSSLSIMAQAPQVGGNVFGGGRMANVTGNSVVLINQTKAVTATTVGDVTTYTPAIAGVYGGNDIAGSVLGSTGSTIIIGDTTNAKSCTISIGSVYGGGNGYYRYGNNTNAASSTVTETEVANDTTVYEWGNSSDHGAAVVTLTSANVIPSIQKTYVAVGGANTVIDSVFAGAKNAYVTKATLSEKTAHVSICNGTIGTVFGGNNYGGSIAGATSTSAANYGNVHIVVKGTTEITGDSYGSYTLGSRPVSDASYTNNKGIKYLFGGGNKVLGANTIITVTDGQIDTLFAGGNSASVLGTSVTINIASEDSHSPLVGGCPDNSKLFDIRTLFGGNNAAEMEILPTLNLNSGSIKTVYGGGNSGNMLADVETPINRMAKGIVKSTYVCVSSDDMVIDELYGGCQKANVENCTYVTLLAGTVNTIYGGNNISGTVGEVTSGTTDAGDTAYVVLRGGTVCGNVFGGSNGFYGCRKVEGSSVVYHSPMVSGYESLATNLVEVPITYNSFVVINTSEARDWVDATTTGAAAGVMSFMGINNPTGVTVKGNVYGAGNMSPQGTLQPDADDAFYAVSPQRMGRVMIDAFFGTVKGDIYGGGRSSDVNGISSIHVDSEGMGDMTIEGRVFGGNDVAGRVTGALGANGTSNLRFATAVDETTELTAANATTYIRVEGMPTIGEVYGGGNGERYISTEPAYTYCNCTANNGNWSTTAPVQTSAWTDIDMECSGVATLGTINTVYGGGNAADVGKATTYITGTGYVDVAFAGGNGADVTEDSPTLTVVTPTNNENCGRSSEGTTDLTRYNVRVIFGGNNSVDMETQLPSVILTKGRFQTVYGGGNAGAMLADDNVGEVLHLSTYIDINSSDVVVSDYVYGGCRMADVENGAYVHISNGTLNNVFGGNDIAGTVHKTIVDVEGGIISALYGGSNGMYDYDESTYDAYDFNSTHSNTTLVAESDTLLKRPVVDTAIVNFKGGTLNNNFYAGGLAANTGSTIATIDGSGIINGDIFGGAKGDVAHIGYCEDNYHPHLGRVTETANLTVKSLSESSPSNITIYGGGHAGDVNNTNLQIINCNRSFRTVYGGCYASHVIGTASTTIQLDEVRSSTYIDTVYGGNNFAGYVYNTELNIDGGVYTQIYGAGNGDYDYKTMLADALSAGCVDSVPYSQFITMNMNPDTVRGTLYGGGNMGVVGKDLDAGKTVKRNPTWENLTGWPQWKQELIPSTQTAARMAALPQGEYGRIIMNITGGVYADQVYAGARGRDADQTNKTTYGRRHLAFAYKQINMYAGYIAKSIHGGSESVDDGYPWECKEAETSLRPSSVLNLMGGTFNKHCYGGGYQGTAYGSAFVNVGIHAVDDHHVWTTTYGPLYTKSDDVWSQSSSSVSSDSYADYKPSLTAGPLYFNASIYNGSDWGAAGAQAVFNTQGFYGGETMIYVDGEDYHTSATDVTSLPAMDIKYSLIGSGTSTEGGDVWRRIFVRHYGDYSCPNPSKSLFSIQRADRVVLDYCYFTLSGESDAYSAYATPNYSLSRIDTLILRGDNLINIEAPARHIVAMYSEKWQSNGTDITDKDIYILHTDLANNVNEMTAAMRNDCSDEFSSDEFCRNLGHAVSPSNKIVLNNGGYISIDNYDTYGQLFGYAYLMSGDGTRSYVYAVDKDGSTSTNLNNGGFAGICNSSNTPYTYNNHDTIELNYTNNTITHYRTWEVGVSDGARNRHITIVANADPTAAGCDDQWLPGGQTENNHDYGFAVAHSSLELPPTEGAHYFKINSVLVDQDNGGQVDLMNAAYNPAGPDGTTTDISDARWDNYRDVTYFTDDTSTAKTSMRNTPDYNFGLMFVLPSTQFNYSAVVPSGATYTYAGSQVLVGGESFTAISGFTSYPVSSTAANVITNIDFYLTYNTDFSTTIIRDVIFNIEEYHLDSQGNEVSDGPIQITVTIATVISAFSDMEVELLAMYNEGVSDTYVRKIVLPATFEYRDLRLTKIEWEYDADINYANASDYHRPSSSELADGTRSDQCLWNMVAADANKTANNQFGFTLNLSENITDNIANTLGWYSIDTRNIDVFKTCADEDGDLDVGTDGTVAGVNNNTAYTLVANYSENDPNKLFSSRDLNIPLGSLDGRASAAIEGVLHFDGTMVYPENPYVGRIRLTLSYTKNNVTNNFHLTFKIKTRKAGDTIYMASAVHGDHANRGSGGLTITRNGLPLKACTDLTAAGAGKRPNAFVIDFVEALRLYKEGDVICILDTVDLSTDDNVTIRGFDYSVIQIIRYSGSHLDAPGKECAYRGPMVRMGKNSRFSVYNAWFNGSGITRVKHTSRTVDVGSGAETVVVEDNRTVDTLWSCAPMIVVAENAQLQLGNNVCLLNNFNSTNCSDSTTNPQGFWGKNNPGGAIGIYHSKNASRTWSEGTITETVNASLAGYPKVTMGYNNEIYGNIVMAPAGNANNGAGIYNNGGTLHLGLKSNGGDEIKICRNYRLTSLTCDGWFQSYSKPMTSFTYASDCSTTSTSQNFGYYKLDTTRVGIDIFTRRVDDQLDDTIIHVPSTSAGTCPASLSNVYLTRKGTTDLTDTQSDLISFNTELSSTSLIGVTKWFPGETTRDTIQIARVSNSRPVTAENMWNNFIFFDDSTKAYTFYHSTVNSYTIYFQRCATFKPYIDSEQLTVYHPTSYHINDSSWCSAVRDSLHFKLQGGFFPYTYTWKTSHYKPATTTSGDPYYTSAYYNVTGRTQTYDWSSAPVVRQRITTGDNVQVNNVPALKAAAQVDTCVLNGLDMPPSSTTFDYTYHVEGVDLTNNCLVPQTVEIRVRRMDGETYAGSTTYATALVEDQKWLSTFGPAATYTRTSSTSEMTTLYNPGVDSSAFHSNSDSTVARYLRIASGVKVSPLVYPTSYNAWVVAHDYYVPQHTFEYQMRVMPSEFTDDFLNVYFCPGDMLNLTTHNDFTDGVLTPKLGGATLDTALSFLMWDFDPEADSIDALYIVPTYNSTITAVYSPTRHWYEVVTSEPATGYTVDYYGNVTISSKEGLAWLISTTNGLNGQRAQQFHFKRITITPIDGGYDMGAYLWTPLGNINNPFSGTFYGDVQSATINTTLDRTTNPYIRNITVNEPNLPYVGFFGNLDSAVVQNVVLESEFLRGNNYVGGLVAVAHNDVVVKNNILRNTSSFSGSYCMGGLIGLADTNVTINGNTVSVSLLGNAIYAGGLVGYQGYNVKIGGSSDSDEESTKNNITNVDASKLQSALYLGGLSGQATHVYGKGSENRWWKRLFGAKPSSDEIADLRNNYVRLVTNGNAMFAGGLLGSATNVNLSNNYVYGRVQAANQAGSLVGQMGSNVTLDHCYYMNGMSTRVFGQGSNTSGSTKYAAFKGKGNKVETSEPIDGVNNMTRLLNRWVRANSDDSTNAYFTWTSDMLGTNSGFPIFGDPDMIPVNDTLVEMACDEYNFNGIVIYGDTVIRMNYIDSVEMIDSTFTLIVSMGHSENELFFDTVPVGSYYVGHGFALTNEELSLLRGTTDGSGVKTVQLVDSLLTEHGCDSVVILNLTIYMKTMVDIEEAETFEVSVFPNPTLGKVTVQADAIETVEVYDAISRRLITVKGSGDDQAVFDLTPYPTGTYYLRVTTPQGVAIKKVIKK